MKRPILPISACLLTGMIGLAVADDAKPAARWYERFVQPAGTIWDDGRPELYLPLHSHHLRSAYTREQIRHFNESPWGLGLGKGLHGKNGDWHGVYALVFQDSHAKPEYSLGYSYKTFWPVLTDDARFGLGMTVLLTSRADIRHYTPFPLLLPIISLEYRDVSLEANFVPGGKKNGNVFFIYGKLVF